MTFQIHLQAMLSAEDHPDTVVLSRFIELPFTPFPGLALYGLLADPADQVYIDSVAFDIPESTFWCDLEDDLYTPKEEDEEDGPELSFDDKIAEYGEEWEVNEPDED